MAMDEYEIEQTIYNIIDEITGEEVSVKSIKRSREIDMLHLDQSLQNLEWAERLGITRNLSIWIGWIETGGIAGDYVDKKILKKT